MLRSKVADAGYTKMLERFARECPKNQFLREFVKNGIQAIQRHISDTGDKKFKSTGGCFCGTHATSSSIQRC